MPKTKFVRVAVSGPTIDGRVIEPAQLTQAAKNYKPDTYAARGNLEHIRGATGDKPFGMYADVLALRTENVQLDVAGKMETRVGLYAQLDVSDDLIALNKKSQKLYSSIELLPNFSGTNEAYLVGLAFTDSPASLGTERLQFSAKEFGRLVSQSDPLDLLIEEPTPAQVANQCLTDTIKDLFKSLIPAPATTPAIVTPAPPLAPAGEFAAFATQLSGTLEKMASAITANQTATDARLDKFAAEHAALVQKLETTPATGYTRQPVATGGNGMHPADY